MEYLVIIQWTEAGDYLAYLPEVPGCAARGDTVEEAERNLGVALDNHLASRRRDAEAVDAAAVVETLSGPEYNAPARPDFGGDDTSWRRENHSTSGSSATASWAARTPTPIGR